MGPGLLPPFSFLSRLKVQTEKQYIVYIPSSTALPLFPFPSSKTRTQSFSFASVANAGRIPGLLADQHSRD